MFYRIRDAVDFVTVRDLQPGDVLVSGKDRAEVIVVERCDRIGELRRVYFRNLQTDRGTYFEWRPGEQEAITREWLRVVRSQRRFWMPWLWGFLLGLAAAWLFYRIALPLYLGQPLIPTP